MANEMQNGSVQKVAYHVIDGAKTMYTVDANAAVGNFPGEWSFAPWSAADASAARSRLEAKHKEDVEAAKAAGQPIPPPLPPPLEPTPAEKTEIDADTKARADAATLLKAADEKEAKEKAEADKIAAARALLATPPPQPDPNARRPFGRKGEMTPAERKAAEKKAADARGKAASDAVDKAAADKIAADKAAADAANPPVI